MVLMNDLNGSNDVTVTVSTVNNKNNKFIIIVSIGCRIDNY